MSALVHPQSTETLGLNTASIPGECRLHPVAGSLLDGARGVGRAALRRFDEITDVVEAALSCPFPSAESAPGELTDGELLAVQAEWVARFSLSCAKETARRMAEFGEDMLVLGLMAVGATYRGRMNEPKSWQLQLDHPKVTRSQVVGTGSYGSHA